MSDFQAVVHESPRVCLVTLVISYMFDLVFQFPNLCGIYAGHVFVAVVVVTVLYWSNLVTNTVAFIEVFDHYSMKSYSHYIITTSLTPVYLHFSWRANLSNLLIVRQSASLKECLLFPWLSSLQPMIHHHVTVINAVTRIHIDPPRQSPSSNIQLDIFCCFLSSNMCRISEGVKLRTSERNLVWLQFCYHYQESLNIRYCLVRPLGLKMVWRCWWRSRVDVTSTPHCRYLCIYVYICVNAGYGMLWYGDLICRVENIAIASLILIIGFNTQHVFFYASYTYHGEFYYITYILHVWNIKP